MIDEVVGSFGEGVNPRIISRLRFDDGNVIQSGQVTTWDFAIYDFNSATPSTPLYSLTAQATALIVTLTTTGWDLDSTGGNFFQRVAGTLISGGYIGGHSYRFKWTLHCVAPYLDVIVSAVGACKSRSA